MQFIFNNTSTDELVDLLKDKFATKDEVAEKADKVEVDAIKEVSDAYSKVEFVDKLPEVGQPNMIYFVGANEADKKEDNEFDEWVWANGKYEKLGNPENEFVACTEEEIQEMLK